MEAGSVQTPPPREAAPPRQAGAGAAPRAQASPKRPNAMRTWLLPGAIAAALAVGGFFAWQYLAGSSPGST